MLTPRQQELFDELIEIIRENGEPMPLVVLSRAREIPPQAVEDVMKAALRSGAEVANLGLSGYACRRWVFALYAGAMALYGEEPFGPRDLRRDFSVPRRCVMDLIDYWQKLGMARKVDEGFQVVPRS